VKKILAAAAVIGALTPPALAGPAKLPAEMLGDWCREAASGDAFVYSRETKNCEQSDILVVRQSGFDLVELECRFVRREVENRKPIDPSLRRTQFRVTYSFKARCGFGDVDRPSNERGMIGLRHEGLLVLEWRP
jgi:hypothetical protein